MRIKQLGAYISIYSMFLLRKFNTFQNQYGDVVKNIKWSVVSVLFLQGGNFVCSILIARIVGKLGFGIYGAIISTAVMIIGVAGAGLSISATKFIAESNFYGKERVGRIIATCQLITLVTGLVYSISLLIFSDFISDYLLNNQEYKIYLLLSIPYVLFMVLNLYQTGALQGYSNFKKIALLNGVNFICNIVVVVVLGILFSLKGIFVAVSLSAMVNWLLYRREVIKSFKKNGIHLDYKNITKESSLLKTFFIPAILSGLLGSVGPWIANLFLISTYNGYDEIALFIAANSYKTFITIIPSLITRVYSPLICKYRIENLLKYKMYVKHLFIISLLISSCISLIIITFFPFLLKLFGSEFVSSYSLILILCFAGLIEVLVACCYQILYSSGIMKYQFVISLLWSVFLALSAYLLVPVWGAVGMASAYLLASVSSVVFYLLLYLKNKMSLNIC